MNKKRLIGAIIAIVCLAGISVAVYFITRDSGTAEPTQAVASFGDKQIKIVIDAGHGGSDVGTIGDSTGVHESELNLKIAQYLQAELESLGVDVVMTRSDGEAIAPTKDEDMALRRQIIETSAQDVTVSIHQNHYEDQSVAGPQVFFCEGSADGERLATNIQNALNKELAPASPRVQHSSKFYIVKSGAAPAVIVECGFLSNPGEEALLQKKQYQMLIVKSIIEGLEEYFNGAA